MNKRGFNTIVWIIIFTLLITGTIFYFKYKSEINQIDNSGQKIENDEQKGNIVITSNAILEADNSSFNFEENMTNYSAP